MIIGLNDFLQVYENECTVSNYKKTIKNFIEGIYEISEHEGDDINRYSITYIKEAQKGKRDWIQDLIKFTEKLKQSKSAYTVKEYNRSVKYWLECNKLIPNLFEKRQIKNRIPAAVSELEEGEMSKKKLYELYQGLVSDETKCMFLLMTGSGSRITETALIKKSDINFNSYPISIRLKAETTKTGQARTILVTSEAAELLQRICKDSEEIVFPNGVYNFRKEWIKMMKESSDYVIIKNRKRFLYHPHMLRKWFISEFSLHASREIAEHLAGHQGYLSKSYRRYNQEEITSEFQKAEQYLSILENKDFKIISCTTSEAYYEA